MIHLGTRPEHSYVPLVHLLVSTLRSLVVTFEEERGFRHRKGRMSLVAPPDLSSKLITKRVKPSDLNCHPFSTKIPDVARRYAPAKHSASHDHEK